MALDLSPKPGRGIWKMELRGRPFDLEALGAALGETATVERNGEQWFLTSPEFPDDATARDVKHVAEGLVEGLVEGLLAVLAVEGHVFSRVELGEFVFERTDRGRNFTLIAEPAAYNMTYAMPLVEAAPVAPPEVLAKRAKLFSTDPNVKRAVKFFIKTDDTFGSIYKAYEIIRDDLGGGPAGAGRAAALAGIARHELDVFYDNAQHEALSGDRARHAGARSGKPKTSTIMPLKEARDLIRKVLSAWMDAK
jgi:hypothetical protein